MAATLLSAQADANRCEQDWNISPLYIATSQNHAHVVDLLIQHRVCF